MPTLFGVCLVIIPINLYMLSFKVGKLTPEDMRRGVATCTKHFLGYGGGINSDEKELMEEIMMPHEVGIKMGNSKAVMTGYHSYKGETATVSYTHLTLPTN